MVKMVIYDCDGVIFDSKRANFEYYNYILKHFGLSEVNENDYEKVEIIHTYSNDGVLKKLFPENLHEKAIGFSKSVDYSMFYKYMKMEPYFLETCNELEKRGIIKTIATNRSRTFPHLFEYFRLNEFIDDYVTVSIVKNPKPAPDMLNHLLKKYKILPEQAIYVGDAIIDYEASKKAKIFFISYKTKIPNVPVINNHLDILKYLKIS